MQQLWRAFQEAIIFFILGVPVVLAGGAAVFLSRKKSLGNRRALLSTGIDVMLVFSLLGIVLVTLWPRPWAYRAASIQLVPLVDSMDILFHSVDWSVPVRNLGCNILLFIPYGFFITWRFGHKRRVLFALITGAVVSVLIEAMQYVLPLGRISSVDDVLFNTLGALLGSALFAAVNKMLPAWFTTLAFTNLNECRR